MNLFQTNFKKLSLILAAVASSTAICSRAIAADTIFELDAGAERETDRVFVFDTVPSNSSTDFANGKTFTVLDGSAHDLSGTIDHLTDRLGQTNGDSCCGPDSESFFAGPAGAEDNLRIQLDLEVDVSIVYQATDLTKSSLNYLRMRRRETARSVITMTQTQDS